MRLKRVVLALVWIVAMLAAACDEASVSSDPLLPIEYAIDPTFRDFYDSHGGESVLGPGISPFFVRNNIYYQYTLNILMMHDPSAPDSERVKLGALGLDMDIQGKPVPPPVQGGVRYIDGHIIYGPFLPLYDALGGVRFTGKPLTEYHYNPEKRRYEQYFANLGFYWLEGDPLDQVHLLAYGVWKCDAKCRTANPESSAVELPSRIAKRFEETVNRLEADFTGYAITEARLTPDGFVEQVFENVVLVYDRQKPGRIFLRAVTERLGYRPDPLQERDPDSPDTFYEIQGGRGYAIPLRIYEYISQHSEFEVSGEPIGEIARTKDAEYQQCFTNLCIKAFLDPQGKITVRPAPLGYTYREGYFQETSPAEGEQAAAQEEEPIDTAPQPQVEAAQPTQAPIPVETQPEAAVQLTAEPLSGTIVQPEAAPQSETATQSETDVQPEVAQPEAVMPAGQVIVQVWEEPGMVAPGQSPEIGVIVFQGGQPVVNVEPDLTLTLPDGTQKTYYMYPTGSDGQSKMLVDPVTADPGTLVPYRICIYDVGGETVCKDDTILIWGGP